MDEDFEILTEIVNEFISTYTDMLNSIQSAKDNQDIKSFILASHSFKGVVSNFFADQITENALKLEIMGKEGNIEGAEEIFNCLKNDTETLVSELKSLCNIWQ